MHHSIYSDLAFINTLWNLSDCYEIEETNTNADILVEYFIN